MDKSQLLGGIICLLLAAFFTVIRFALPLNEQWFLVGEANIPLVPIILGIVGLLLLLTARRSKA